MTGRQWITVACGALLGLVVMMPQAIVPGMTVQVSSPNHTELRPVPGSGLTVDPGPLASALLNGLLLGVLVAAPIVLAKRSPWFTGRWLTAASVLGTLGVCAVYLNALRPTHVAYDCANFIGRCFDTSPGLVGHSTTILAALNGLILFGFVVGASILTRRIRSIGSRTYRGGPDSGDTQA
jgi:hypothetical protein